VHAYSVGVMGPVLSIFIGLNLIIYSFLITRRWKQLKDNSARSLLTASDLAIRVFNFLILALVLLFFIGQTYPLTSQLFTGAQITWDEEQYEVFSPPLLILLLLTTAICPILNFYEKARKKFWQKLILSLLISLVISSIFLIRKEVGLIEAFGFWTVFFLIVTWTDLLISRSLILLSNNKKDFEIKGGLSSFGSILIHIGLGLMAFGIMGQETLSDSYDLRITEGETVNFGDFQINIQDKSQIISPEGTTFSIVDFSIQENGQKEIILSPDQEYYPKMQMLYARPAIVTSLERDIQIILTTWQDEKDFKFEIHVSINPFMIWIWIGGLLLSFGGLCILVQKRKYSSKN